jgi:hypothetical protein
MRHVIRLTATAWEARCAAAGAGADGAARRWRVAAPLWFDTAIGYWTGEPDWAGVAGALERFAEHVEAGELVFAAEEAGEETAISWQPAAGRPVVRVLVQAAGDAWIVQVLPEPCVRITAVGEATAEAVRVWAAAEGWTLEEEDGAAWP